MITDLKGLPAAASCNAATERQFPIGTMMTKKRGSSWTGRVVGYYSTELTAQGVCVESIYEQGSVQIYPINAMQKVD